MGIVQKSALFIFSQQSLTVIFFPCSPVSCSGWSQSCRDWCIICNTELGTSALCRTKWTNPWIQGKFCINCQPPPRRLQEWLITILRSVNFKKRFELKSWTRFKNIEINLTSLIFAEFRICGSRAKIGRPNFRNIWWFACNTEENAEPLVYIQEIEFDHQKHVRNPKQIFIGEV